MCSEKTIIYLKAYISIKKKKNLPISAMFQTFLPETNGLCSDKTWWECLGFPGGWADKRIHLQCGRSGLGRSPGEANSHPLQYFALENSMNRVVHGVSGYWHWYHTLTELFQEVGGPWFEWFKTIEHLHIYFPCMCVCVCVHTQTFCWFLTANRPTLSVNN